MSDAMAAANSSSTLALTAAGPSAAAVPGASTSAELTEGAGAADGAGAAALALEGPSSDALLLPGDSPPAYHYSQEIAQMMFVFGDVEDPPADVLKLIEDIVRTQVVEMIIQSRRIAQRRASRTLSPEDLMFLIRYDRAKVNRLRTYLSWREVHKKAKESDDAGAGGAAEAELDDAGAMDAAVRVRKMNVKLPWELSSIFSEHLRPMAGDDADEEDEDDIEAHEDSLSRLKEADEATRMMTREEYVHYSECRQASFTFRKGKKFRDFINAPAYLGSGKSNDDIIDVLGFLAFEVVRELCEGALRVHKELEETARVQAERKRLAIEAVQERERNREAAEREKGVVRQQQRQHSGSPSKDAGSGSGSKTSPVAARKSLEPQAPAGPSPGALKRKSIDGGQPSNDSAQPPLQASSGPSGILKTVTGGTGATGTPSENIDAAQGDDANARPRKRARFVEPAEQSSSPSSAPTPSIRSTGPFAAVLPAPVRDSENNPDSHSRGKTLSMSRAYDGIETHEISSLFLPQPGASPDPRDASTFCALFAPLPGAAGGGGGPASVSLSPSPSPALTSTARFGIGNGNGNGNGTALVAGDTGKADADANLGGKGKGEGDDEDGDGEEDDGDGSSADGEEDEIAAAAATASKTKQGGATTASAPSSSATKEDTNASATAPGPDSGVDGDGRPTVSSRKNKPPAPQLATSHIYEAFARLQRRRTALAGAARTGGTGGLRRTRMFVI